MNPSLVTHKSAGDINRKIREWFAGQKTRCLWPEKPWCVDSRMGKFMYCERHMEVMWEPTRKWLDKAAPRRGANVIDR